MLDLSNMEWLRWTGAAILTFMLIFGLFIIARYPLGKQASISRHIASQPILYVLVGLFLTIAGGVFYAFLLLWIVPTYQMHPIIYPILAIAYIAQLGLAWIPDKAPAASSLNIPHTLHFVCGAIVAIAMMLSLYILCFSFEHLALFSRIFVITSAIFSTACILIYSFIKQSRRHFLIYESIYILLFSAAMYSLILKI